MERVVPSKPSKYINYKNERECREFQDYMERCYVNFDLSPNVEQEFTIFNELWNTAIGSSFKKITPRGNQCSGISDVVRELMKEEKQIRKSILNNPERGRQIAIVRKKIRMEIEENIGKKCLEKVQQIQQSKNPQGEIFKVRREMKKSVQIGFPLKDSDGIIQVNKKGIDDVVIKHFQKVFDQNPIPEGDMWVKYWKTVDEVFETIEKSDKVVQYQLPSLLEIKAILASCNNNKAVLGNLKPHLLKLGGEKVAIWIHKFLRLCCYQEKIPPQLRSESMAILYKNKGELSSLDNYRGIFIRIVIMSILQKWMYSKCAPIIDNNGSEYAFGGRKGRSHKEALVILRLVQDHSRWTKQPLILKFLDVTKFFDMMNYRKCMIELFKSGVTGKFWRLYKLMNEFKVCVPHTPMGETGVIQVKEVFVQGSSDAMLMAWNLMDSVNKSSDFNDPVFIIEGIKIPRILFVDDILQMLRSVADLKASLVDDEVIEKVNRFDFKPSKCKVMFQNCEPEPVELDNVVLDNVENHEYLGTIVEESGYRRKDLLKRVNDCKGVLNEIVEVLKVNGMNVIRLQYIGLYLCPPAS